MLMRQTSISVEKHFDRAANTYDAHARVQRYVAARLAERLPELGEGTRVLELGSGSGLFTEHVSHAYGQSEIIAIDRSQKMCERARSRSAVSIKFLSGDLADYSGIGTFDLVCSSSAMHWIRAVPELCARTFSSLKSGGVFLGSIFLEGTLGELHSLKRELFPTKQPPIILPRFSCFLDPIQEAGFILQWTDTFEVVSEHLSLFDMFQELRTVGVTAVIESEYQPLSRGELRTLTEQYERRFRSVNGIFATYVCGQFLAVKP